MAYNSKRDWGIYRIAYKAISLGFNQLKEITSLSKSTIYKMITEKKFPKQIQAGPQQVDWTKDAVQDCMNQKIQGGQRLG